MTSARRNLLTLSLIAGLSLLSHASTTVVGDESVCFSDGSERAALLASLRSREVPTGSSIRVEPGPAPADLSSTDRRVRVGRVVADGTRVDFAGLQPSDLTRTPRAHGGGAIRGDGRGGFVWTGAVESPGAAALRLRFAGFALPGGAQLFLYSDAGDVFGPYTDRGPLGDGAFWSHTLRGSRVTLQLFYDGEDAARALGVARFVLADVGHLDEAPFASGPGAEPRASNLCSFNADCIVNAETAALPAAVEAARAGIAMIHYVSGRWLYACSGGLLADSQGSERPLFLTANHCVSKGREAKSVEAFFQYVKDPNDPGCSPAGDPRTLGSSILASSRDSDFTLLELDEPAPAGSAFLSWNVTPIAHDQGAALYRISHPRAAPQAYSAHSVDTSRATCSSWPRGPWIYSSDQVGGTEGGSSGSPVLNAQGEVVGQLSGACGFNVSDSCDSAANATVDGALASYFADVEAFLDPGPPCADADGDGACDADDCDDGDASIYPGAAEICGDGIDQDCNGADQVCTSCALVPVGGACAADGECCSGKCRGRPGSKTCR